MLKTFITAVTFVLVVNIFALSYGDEDLLKTTGFDSFCKEWINILNDKGCYSKEHLCVRKDENNPDVVIAEYRQIGDIIEKRVKKTKSDKVPYVGILKYYVVIYRSRGNTADEAMKGPFSKGDVGITTEIFYYKDGKWIY